MNLNAYKEKVVENVIEPMISFMEDWDDCDYNTEDVGTCKSLIYTYLEALAAMAEPTDETIMEQVKTLVLALNDLNEKADYSLIETEAREAIWEDSFGIGVYVPGEDNFLAGVYARETTDTENPSKAAPTSYIALVDYMTFESFKPFEYDFYLSTGTTTEMRENFSGIE